MEIRNWKGTEVIYKAEVNIMKELVKKAVKKGVSLAYAKLNHADLHGEDLSDANLHTADLRCADLSGADLRDADLSGAYLIGANLSGADLSGANIELAYLNGANLEGANLKGAGLRRADFNKANLCGADFSCADLNGADFSRADLRGANLEGAVIRYALLGFARNVPENLPMACPKEGSFVAWKKVNGKLVKLEIPADAKRSSATTNKCRCDKAKVLAITDLDGTNPINEVVNKNYKNTIYRVGEMVYPDCFDGNRWRECSHGIHFFIEKIDAITY